MQVQNQCSEELEVEWFDYHVKNKVEKVQVPESNGIGMKIRISTQSRYQNGFE